MEILFGVLVLSLIVVATLVFFEIQNIKQELRSLASSSESVDSKVNNEIIPALELMSLGAGVLRSAIADHDKRVNDVAIEMDFLAGCISNKQDKRTLTIDEALARIPKKSALKEKKPSRKTPTLAHKLTKVKQ